jgi:hypothetical protein
MSKKIHTFDVQSDVTKISIDAYDALINIVSVSDGKTTLTFDRGPFIHAACSENELVIKQGKRLFAKLRKKPQINLNIPEYLVPSVQYHGKYASLSLQGGIFAELDAYSVRGKINLSSAAFESVDIKGEEVALNISSLTVKDCLSCNIQSGEAVIENTFATHTECRNKGGNVGIVKLNSKDSFLEAENGNVTATILGKKEDFNLTLQAKEGTCNMDSDEGKNCSGAIKAFTGNGNIVIDFTD